MPVACCCCCVVQEGGTAQERWGWEESGPAYSKTLNPAVCGVTPTVAAYSKTLQCCGLTPAAGTAGALRCQPGPYYPPAWLPGRHMACRQTGRQDVVVVVVVVVAMVVMSMQAKERPAALLPRAAAVVHSQRPQHSLHGVRRTPALAPALLAAPLPPLYTQLRLAARPLGCHDGTPAAAAMIRY